MRTPRPRPVPPGSSSPRGSAYPQKSPLRTGSLQAMKEQALRKAAQHTDMTYKRD